MGWGFRVYLLGQDGHFRRFPHTRYANLSVNTPQTRLPDHAGGEARFVFVVVETEGRLPVRVCRMEYNRFEVLLSGDIDLERRKRYGRLAVDALASQVGLGASGEPNLLAAEHRFIKRRIDHEFHWKPSRAQLQEVERLLFEPQAGRPRPRRR